MSAKWNAASIQARIACAMKITNLKELCVLNALKNEKGSENYTKN
jgi:hypothetical protein